MRRPSKKLRRGAPARRVVRVGPESNGSFGPAFFSTQLRALIRNRCPGPEDATPAVAIHLASGDVLDVCHVIGLAATWLALAVYDTVAEGAVRSMRTELVPYAMITRITISQESHGISRIGFDPDHPPIAIESAAGGTGAEQLLRMVATAARAAPRDQDKKPRRPSS